MNIYRISSIFLIIFISSCSINSPQYNFLRDQFFGQKQKTDPNWTLTWMDNNKDMFAVNDENYIYFINFDGVFIKFNGKQIIEVSGLFPDESKMNIQRDGTSLIYFVNNHSFESDTCNDWLQYISSKTREWKQICYEKINDYNYTNSIVMNEIEQIIGLKFKVNSNYPPIIMRMNEHKDIKFD
tara:strand:+ start:54 stop:602 length:549 start_codon:yes stop_codon:yes gene_type:complete